MKERPILYGAPMIRALKAGIKTQTRRTRGLKELNSSPDSWEVMPSWCDGEWIFHTDPWTEAHGIECPYGKPGDVLWTRETFAIENNFNMGDYDPPLNDGRPVRRHDDPDYGKWWEQCHYRATDPTPELAYEDSGSEPDVRWKPSIHMPKWASRLRHVITDVSLERLLDITFDDAIAEGVFADFDPQDGHGFRCEARIMFFELWDSINKKRGLGSDVNPWVWKITFEECGNG